VDRNVGRLLDYLKDNDLEENTVVIYMSDQGFYLGEHGWFDKRFMYEESFRTPLLIRYPRLVKAGSENTDLVQNIDLAPTLLALADIDIPKEMQGRSLRPLLTQEDVEWRKALYYHYYEYPGIHMVKRHYGIRTDRYKLIHFYYDIDEWEMYDLETDPEEMHNIYGHPEYREIQNILYEQLQDLRKQYQDTDALNRYFIQYDLKRLERLDQP
jgi:arylsulfatase A-like enzyme